MAIVLLLLTSPTAGAGQIVHLGTRFTPNVAGKSTTVVMSFAITTPTGVVPSPLKAMVVRLPAGMSLASTTLGLATCKAEALEVLGVPGCPPNSLMGTGVALVEVPLGRTGALGEPVNISIFMSEPIRDHTTLIFNAEGSSPLSAQIVFPGIMTGDNGRFGAQLQATIPTTPTVPEGPDAALVSLHVSLGPLGLVYFHKIHGRAQPYRPSGMTIPLRCPRGGFPVAATFHFDDGTNAAASSASPCPKNAARPR